jgi:hypothetical protein
VKLPEIVDKLLTKVELGAINRWHILAILCLGVTLLFSGSNQKFELIGGNYTNIISATVSLLVLSEQKRSEKRQVDRHEEMKDHITSKTEGGSDGS